MGPIEKYYTNMTKYVNYVASKAGKDGIVAYGLGDWCDANSNVGTLYQLMLFVRFSFKNKILHRHKLGHTQHW